MAAADRPTDDLLRRMLAAVSAEASDAHIEQLIARARAEAESEIAQVLKSAFKASLLRRTVEQLERGEREPAPRPASAFPPPASRAPEIRDRRSVAAAAVADDTSAEGEASVRTELPRGPSGPGLSAPGPAPAEPAASDLPTPAAGEAEEPRPAKDDGQSFGCYVYAMTPARPDNSRAAGGADDDGTATATVGAPSVDPRFPIEVVRFADVQALVSRVSLEEFGQAGLNDRVGDAAWVEAKVRAHDRVVSSALSAGAVIPCRFCTVLRSPQDVRRLLAEHRDRIVAALAALDGKKEWGVKLYARPASPARQRAPRDTADNAAAAGKTYLRAKSREESVRGELERAARARAEESHLELAAAAADATLLPLKGKGGAGGGGRTLVLNCAYLVPDADGDRFHAAVADLAERHAADGLDVEVTGPWPPYNFVRLDLSLEAAA